MKKFTIDSIVLANDDIVSMKDIDVIIFVGPNNAGKTESIQGIYEKIRSPDYNSKNIKSISYSINLPDFGRDEIIEKSIHSGENYSGHGWGFHKSYLDNWNPAALKQYGMREVRGYFCEYLNTETRLHLANNANQIDVQSEPPTHPFHKCYRDDQFEMEISEYTKRAFDQEIIIDRGSGSTLPAYIGKRPELLKGEDRISIEYLNRIRSNSKLPIQGDGIRAFVGISIYCLSQPKPLIFLDEPETFLHPPQARILGEIIANSSKSNYQIFLSTHSIDLINGILSASAKTKIIRIDRSGLTSSYKEITSEDISSFKKNSFFRQTNLLDSCFYKHTIVCESDMDAMFYSQIVNDYTAKNSIPTQDINYIHCGGKHRIPEVVSQLKAIGVNPIAIIDIDALDNKAYVKKLVDSYSLKGTNLNLISELNRHLLAKAQSITCKIIKSKINKILDESDSPISDDQIDDIREVLKLSKPWRIIKKLGIDGIDDPFKKRVSKLIGNLHSEGIILLRGGEIESFGPSLGSLHGPKWLEAMNENGLNANETENVNTFVRDLIGLLDSRHLKDINEPKDANG
jgi:hypothetical protein